MTSLQITGAKEPELVDRIVAVVNGDIISFFELNQMAKPYIEKIRSMGYPDDKSHEMILKIREDILNQLIDQKLTDQEIGRRGITVSEKETDSAIDRLLKEANLKNIEELEKALAKEGLTLEEYRQKIKEQILRGRLVNAEIKSGIVITKEDIKAYYESHYNEYEGEKKYHLRNIIMKADASGSEADKPAVKKRMETVLDKLKAGESFEKTAKKYSEVLAGEGGDLGYFKFNELSPQIQDAIKGLKDGEFSGILDTDVGYQIFFVQEIINMKGISLEDISSEIQEKLFNEFVNKKFQSWVEELRKRSYIKIML